MYKSAIVHLQNKYPGCQVIGTENSLDVFTPAGELLVAVRRDGNGAWNDQQKELGARDKFDLAPIPKHARVRKLFADGRIGNSEEADSRRKNAKAYADAYNGRVPSLHEIAGGGADGAQVCKTDGFAAKFADDQKPVLPEKAK